MATGLAALVGIQYENIVHAKCDSSDVELSMAETTRRSVYFGYEARLRKFSPPEKLFAYFASAGTSKEPCMIPLDLMRAAVPVFQPIHSTDARSGSLAGEPKHQKTKRAKTNEFFSLFDIDKNGLIDFPEFVFFITLLSIPEEDVKVAFMMFDTDDSGTLDRQEFKAVMSVMRQGSRVGRASSGLRPGLLSHGKIEDGGLVEHFFGKKGTDLLTFDKFNAFLKRLHNEMVLLEFEHYDYLGSGFMCHKDFALSLIASGDVAEIPKYLQRVNTLPEFGGPGVSFKEFEQVTKLRPKLSAMHTALSAYGNVNGKITKHHFIRAAKKICQVDLTAVQVDIMYHVFDLDGDGSLDPDEFFNMMSKRNPDKSRKGNSESDSSSVFNCVQSCWENRHLMEDQFSSKISEDSS
eukprot:CAMPEP_0196592294 /NCGR_PEP_ID=MMETSP1081-20130531/72329_1 /TAXON_ID=36882 /ORGANISM="Pyramimonas amylifera, Strain CCMP720" /LENGTH=405 /DNA_ID=CAMNT_0041915927 /DNA_START=286 /DNA_END=1503 /DNA_ORIENTATION=+